MGSVWASLSGIRAHQFMLDVIGNNLANANTTGFKASRVAFSEMMSQTLRQASAGTDALGATNPSQVGLGVQIGAVNRDFGQGGFQDTGSQLDLAIDGSGFLVLHDGTDIVFTRSTTFNIDPNNNVVDSLTGYRLLSTENTPISIPYNEQIPANKTAKVTLAGNLSADTSLPQKEILTTISPLLSGGSAATAATNLNDLDTNTTDYVDGDTIKITGTAKDGSTITSVFFTYGAANDGTTLGDLINAVNTAFSGEAVCTIDSDGTLMLSADEEGDASLSLVIADDSGTGATTWGEHVFYIQTDGADGGTHRVSATIYDSRGRSQILTLTFQRTAELTWNMTGTLSGTEGTLTKDYVNGIRFGPDGSFNYVDESGANAQKLVVDFGGSAEDQTIELDFGTSAKFDGLTSQGGSHSATAKQDGYTAGSLRSFNIGHDGKIQGIYSNGQRRDLTTVLMATFDNPEGLETQGDGTWTTTVSSGDPILGTAMSGRAGAIKSGVLEQSNVESAEELTKLIIAQYGFQVNTRVMAVSNRIIQELTSSI